MKTDILKRLSIIFIAISAIFLMACDNGKDDILHTEQAEVNFLEEHGQLSFVDGKLVDHNNEPVQLRGVSTHGVAWFPEFNNANAFKSIKEAGGNVIRVAAYTEGDNCYLSNPENTMNLVFQAIENAKSLGLYVIVDWHILNDGDPRTHQAEAITFFDAIASRYKNDPAIIYEICNEPNGVGWTDIMEYGYAMFPVIRQYSPDAVILMGVPDYSASLSYASATPFPEKNFAYTFHYYAGEHRGYAELENAVNEGLPVFVSEWGCGKDSTGEFAYLQSLEFYAYLNSNDISWCAWSLCNKDEIYSMIKTDCEKIGDFTEEDLTQSGKVIFEALKGRKKVE